MKKSARYFLILAILAAVPFLFASANDRATLFPNVRAGQILTYLIQLRADRDIKTESNVAAPLSPNGAQIDAHGLLLIEILNVSPEGRRNRLRARARFAPLDLGISVRKPEEKTPDSQEDKINAPLKFVEFAIHADGSVDQVKGLEEFSLEQQQAWREWATKFAIAGAFPKDGVKRGEKWETSEKENSPAPVAGLSWNKNWQYVRDEPCRPAQISARGEIADEATASETCAVVLSTAKLRQKSSAKNSSPADYQLHQLKTMGTAKGENEVIAYISLRTGLVVRATEQAHQYMDVVVAKADDTNRVHYNVEAKSTSEVRLVSETPLVKP